MIRVEDSIRIPQSNHNSSLSRVRAGHYRADSENLNFDRRIPKLISL
jgi:hypothetical protein